MDDGWIVGWMGKWTDKQREGWMTLDITRACPEFITTLLSPEPPLTWQVATNPPRQLISHL